MTIRISLGSEGLDYILAELRTGLTFARELAGVTEWHRVYTELPQGVPRDELLDFRSGGKVPESRKRADATIVQIPTMNVVLSEEIRRYLALSIRHVSVFENWLARRGDEHVMGRSDVFFCGDEVYHLIRGGARSVTDIETTIRKAHSIPHFIGAMTSWPWVLNLCPNAEFYRPMFCSSWRT